MPSIKEKITIKNYLYIKCNPDRIKYVSLIQSAVRNMPKWLFKVNFRVN